MWVRFPLPALSKGINLKLTTVMKAHFLRSIAPRLAWALIIATSTTSIAQTANSCMEISNDVRVAVEKDPTKVLMVVEDALVINEGCAADIVKAAIIASKADAKLAGEIAQTAVSVAPKMAAVINEAATAVMPGLVVAPSGDQRPVTVSGKNPGKNPVLDSPEPEKKTLDSPEPTMGPIRGVQLVPPTISGPVPPRTTTNPVSPSNAIP